MLAVLTGVAHAKDFFPVKNKNANSIFLYKLCSIRYLIYFDVKVFKTKKCHLEYILSADLHGDMKIQ